MLNARVSNMCAGLPKDGLHGGWMAECGLVRVGCKGHEVFIKIELTSFKLLIQQTEVKGRLLQRSLTRVLEILPVQAYSCLHVLYMRIIQTKVCVVQHQQQGQGLSHLLS